MIDQVRDEANRIEARFLEPACGSGNFLVPILQRKFASVEAKYGKSSFERQNFALVALMSIYGIELLPDNVSECLENLVRTFKSFVGDTVFGEFTGAASVVTKINIVRGDALTMRTAEEPAEPISFSEWSYLGRGKFNRREFRFDSMTQASGFNREDTLFADLGKHEIFSCTKDFGALTVSEISEMA